jgi:hypothetical protein
MRSESENRIRRGAEKTRPQWLVEGRRSLKEKLPADAADFIRLRREFQEFSGLIPRPFIWIAI